MPFLCYSKFLKNLNQFAVAIKKKELIKINQLANIYHLIQTFQMTKISNINLKENKDHFSDKELPSNINLKKKKDCFTDQK